VDSHRQAELLILGLREALLVNCSARAWASERYL